MKFTPSGAWLLALCATLAAPALANDLIAIAAAMPHAGQPHAGQPSLLFDQIFAIPVWGVPVTTFGAAATGAGLSLFVGEPLPPKHLWGQVALATIFGVAFAVLVTDFADLDWAAKHPSMFALVVAGGTRWFLPTAIERGKQLIRDFNFSFGKRKGEP